MLGFLFVSCLLSIDWAAAIEGSGKEVQEWAVLVAGSNGFYNYRHQADVAHAYHLLRDKGIPAERIITFAYDDIAHNPENPFPGQIFNDFSHTDYYEGLVIDYKGKNVTPTMFMHVLKGDPQLKQKGLKVLESGPNDHVFIYFTDHGGPDIICFPDDDLFSHDLNDTINYLHQNKMYDKLVLYVEACESGSMFNGILSPNINVFATTAANPHESSYGIFCNDSKVDACLADEYSYNWIKDSETHDLAKLTLQRQFLDVKEKTVKSHVQEYGDKSLGNLPVSQFQGDHNVTVATNRTMITGEHAPSRQAHIYAMLRAVLRANSIKEKNLAKRRLLRATKLGQLAEETMKLVVESVQLKSIQRMTQPVSTRDVLNCYKKAYATYKKYCFSIQRVPEVAGHIRHLRDLCEEGVRSSDIVAAIEKNCV